MARPIQHLLLMLAVLVAACAPGGAPDEPAAAPDSPADAAAPTPEMSDEESELKKCVEAAGYDYDEAYPPHEGPDPPPEGSLWAEDTFIQTHNRCLVEAGFGESVRQDDPEWIAERNRETIEHMECMRDRGWNIPDPNVDTEEYVGMLVWRYPNVFRVPDDPEERDQVLRDKAECGRPVYDDEGNILP